MWASTPTNFPENSRYKEKGLLLLRQSLLFAKPGVYFWMNDRQSVH